jgi:hypothetical protein
MVQTNWSDFKKQLLGGERCGAFLVLVGAIRSLV